MNDFMRCRICQPGFAPSSRDTVLAIGCRKKREKSAVTSKVVSEKLTPHHWKLAALRRKRISAVATMASNAFCNSYTPSVGTRTSWISLPSKLMLTLKFTCVFWGLTRPPYRCSLRNTGQMKNVGSLHFPRHLMLTCCARSPRTV